MEIQLIRNATLKLSYAGKTILVDPMLCAKEAFPPFAKGLLPNPTVDLTIPAKEVATGVDAVLVTHSHPDHFDEASSQLLPKNIKLVCTPADRDFEKFGPPAEPTVEEVTPEPAVEKAPVDDVAKRAAVAGVSVEELTKREAAKELQRKDTLSREANRELNSLKGKTDKASKAKRAELKEFMANLRAMSVDEARAKRLKPKAKRTEGNLKAREQKASEFSGARVSELSREGILSHFTDKKFDKFLPEYFKTGYYVEGVYFTGSRLIGDHYISDREKASIGRETRRFLAENIRTTQRLSSIDEFPYLKSYNFDASIVG